LHNLFSLDSLSTAAEAGIAAVFFCIICVFLIQSACRALGIQTKFWSDLDAHRAHSGDDDY
jgi:hypothetical protein